MRRKRRGNYSSLVILRYMTKMRKPMQIGVGFQTNESDLALKCSPNVATHLEKSGAFFLGLRFDVLRLGDAANHVCRDNDFFDTRH